MGAGDLGPLQATLGCDVSELRSAEQQMRAFGSSAESTFNRAENQASSLGSELMKLTAVVTTVYVAYQKLSDVINTGMRVETMSVVMQQIGKNTGVSSDALKYFTEQIKSAGVTGMEAMSSISKALVIGLDLNRMKEFTTRVRDVAVGARDAEGNLLNTSQTLMRVMHGIESGQLEVLRTMGVSVRNMDVVYKEYAASIGKTSTELNAAQKGQAILNEFMRASAPLAGAAAQADKTVGKQIASMARYSEEAKVALWGLFSPGMMAGVQTLTQGFKDLTKWAKANADQLHTIGETIGSFVSRVGTTALETLKWAASNFELVKSLTELYIISKVMSWINGFRIAIAASSMAVVIFTGVIKGLIPILLGAEYGVVTFTANAVGATTAVESLTAAGVALNSMMIILLPAIVAVSGALAAYGAYKSFTGKGDLGQGIGSPGTSTMGTDMWEYVDAVKAIPEDPFRGPSISCEEFNVKLTETKKQQNTVGDWLETKWTMYLETTQASKELSVIIDKIQSIIDMISTNRVWNIMVNLFSGTKPSGTEGLLPDSTGNKLLQESNAKYIKDRVQGLYKTSDERNILGGQSLATLDAPKVMREKLIEIEATAAFQKKLNEKTTGKGGKAGKGADGAAESLRSFIATMESETARGAGDSWAILDAWYDKQIIALDKIAAKGVEVTDGKKALDAARGQKAQKIEEDFDKWYTGAMGMTTLTQINEDKRKLDSVKDHADEEKKVREVIAQHEIDRKRKTTDTILGIESQTLAAMASASPYLEDQLTLQKRQLEIDIKRGNLQFEEQIRLMKMNDGISEAQANELRGLHALENQAKKYAEARKSWTTEGWQGGLKIAAVDAQNTANTWQADQVASWLKSAPQQISQTMASAFVGALQGKKTDFDALAYSMAESLIQKQLEGLIVQIMPKAIEGLMQLLGIELPAKQTAAETAAITLEVGGVNAGIAMVNGAIQAASILSGGKSGGNIGDMLGGFVKIAGSLFGGGSPTSVGVPSYSPSPDTSWGNAAYSNFLSSARPMAEGGIVTRPTLAYLREGGEDEAVIPLSKLSGNGPPQVNVNIYPPANTEARTETQPNGDIDVFFDQMGAKAYNRRGLMYKAINSGSGATKR